MKHVLALGSTASLIPSPPSPAASPSWIPVPNLQVEPGNRYRFAAQFLGGTSAENKRFFETQFVMRDVNVWLPGEPLPIDWPGDDEWLADPVSRPRTMRAEGTWSLAAMRLPVPPDSLRAWLYRLPAAPPPKSPLVLWGAAGALVVLAGGLGVYAYSQRKARR